MLNLLKYHSRSYRAAVWLGALLLGGAQVYSLFARPEGVYLADPFSSSIIATALISGALFAANYAYNYFVVTRRKVPPQDRGRMDDIRVQANGYGEFIARGYGKFRTAGILIDATEVTHTESTTPGQPGGKGTPKPPTPGEIRHLYTTTLAVAICEGMPDLAPDLAVTRIWENVDVIYDTTVETLGDGLYEAERAGNTLAGGAAEVADATASGGEAVELPTNGSVQWNSVYGDGGNAFLEFYYKSTAANTVDFTWNANNFSDTLNNSGGEWILYRSAPFGLNDGFVNTIKIKNTHASVLTMDYLIVRISARGTGAVNLNLSRFGTDEDVALPFHGHLPRPEPATGTTSTTLTAGGRVNVRIYTGTETQTPDSALVALHGADYTPAYRGTVYVVFDSYSLKDPYIPNFTFEVNTGVRALDEIVPDLYSLVGVASAKLDVTALASDELDADEGFVISSREQAGRWIEDLQTRFQFDMVEVDGVVKAVKRNGASVATITTDELRAKWSGDGEGEGESYEALITDIDELALPASVEVGYMDPLNDYHNNVQTAMRGSGNSQDPQTVNLPMVITATNARRLAETILYQRHMESRGFGFKTGPRYTKLHPGDVVTLSLSNATHTCRIVEQKISIMGPVEFEAVRVQSSVYTQTLAGTSGSGYEAHVIPYPANTKWLILDTALLRPEDAGDGTQPVVYVPACVLGSGTWRGAFLHKEVPKDSGSYETRLAIDTEAFIGVVSSGTAGTIDRTVWDRSTSIVVDWYPVTTLSSVTEAQAADNPEINLLAIGSMATGWHIAQYTTVSSGSASDPFQSRHTISGLLWDRFGTGAPSAGSLAGLDVVILNGAVRPMRVELEDIGRARNYKMTSAGQVPSDIPTPTSFTLQGNALKPPAPVSVRGERDDAGNLLITWQRRGRIGQNMRDYADVPLGEERDEYVVEVYSGSTLLREMRGLTPWMSLPVLFETTANTKNYTITNTSLTTVAARSLQVITAPGNFIEATLSLAAADTNMRAVLGVVAPGAYWNEASLTAAGAEYEVTLSYNGSAYVLVVNRFGSLVTSVSGVNSSERIRITFSGSEFRFYRDWQSPSTVPFYIGTFAPSFPYHAYARVRGDGATNAGAVTQAKMTVGPTPATVYSAAQQTKDFGSTQSSVKVRIYQTSAMTGRGQHAEVTI